MIARLRSRFVGALVGFLVVAGAALLVAQGIRVMTGSGSTLVTVDTNNNLRTAAGESTLASYTVGVSNAAITALDEAIMLEGEAGRGFRITQVCINPGNATAVATTLWQLIRETTAGSGGTAITAEVTSGNNFLARMDPADASWSGAARTTGTGGTSGAVLDSGTAFIRITATPPAGENDFCRVYCVAGAKCPTIPGGTANGVKLMWTGVAGGVNASFYISFIAD